MYIYITKSGFFFINRLQLQLQLHNSIATTTKNTTTTTATTITNYTNYITTIKPTMTTTTKQTIQYNYMQITDNVSTLRI